MLKTREIVRFKRYDGSIFHRTFIVKDNEISQDIIEDFIYNYNKVSEMCNYNYEVLEVKTIM